jgi:hypothetical protein
MVERVSPGEFLIEIRDVGESLRIELDLASNPLEQSGLEAGSQAVA